MSCTLLKRALPATNPGYKSGPPVFNSNGKGVLGENEGTRMEVKLNFLISWYEKLSAPLHLARREERSPRHFHNKLHARTIGPHFKPF